MRISLPPEDRNQSPHFFRMRKIRFREIKWPTQDHTASTDLSRDSALERSKFKSTLTHFMTMDQNLTSLFRTHTASAYHVRKKLVSLQWCIRPSATGRLLPACTHSLLPCRLLGSSPTGLFAEGCPGSFPPRASMRFLGCQGL